MAVAERRRKLASYEVAGLDEANGSRPERTMEDCPHPPSFQDGFLFGLFPATMWLANFRLSLWDEAGSAGGAKLFHLFDELHSD
jgi:hypothetical protein